MRLFHDASIRLTISIYLPKPTPSTHEKNALGDARCCALFAIVRQ